MVDLPSNLPSQRRLNWMDFVRGFAILLVILLHSVDITVKYAGELPAWLEFVTRSFDPLRMPLMTFLSGMLLARSLSKGTMQFLIGKTRNILFPYVVWSSIYIIMWNISSPLTAGEHSWSDFLDIFYNPPGHLWFIYNIFLYYCFMLLARDVPLFFLMGLTWLIARMLSPFSLEDWNRFFFLFGFFVLGHYATLHAATLGRLLGDARVIALLVIGSLTMPAAVVLFEESVRYQPISLPMAISGIGLTLIVGDAVGAKAALAPIRYVGVRSLPAFILHWLIIAATVIALTKVLGVDQPMTVFLITFVISITATLVALLIIDRSPLRFLFAWP